MRDDPSAHTAAGPTPRQRIKRLIRLAIRIIAFPLRLFLSIRVSMTAASVTLLLVWIITLNIIWGFPWLGMFSACVSLLFVGFAINRLMRPHLRISYSLPSQAPADQAFTITTHLKNRRRVPAMDLTVEFDRPSDSARVTSHSRSIDHWTRTAAHNLKVVRPGERMDLTASIASSRRGIHLLPDLVVTSMFPFHLFRHTGHWPSNTEIAITPRPLRGDDDAMSRGLLDTLGDWTHRLLAGNALDYTGSREYEVGMPVRSWDFRSWARLGRPIVREFQSPSIQMVTLIVDTSITHAGGGARSAPSMIEPGIERVLSLAATSITDLTRKMVRVCLYVSSEPASSLDDFGPTQSHLDTESLLIRLAAAEYETAETADRRIPKVIELLGGSPGLILTARRDHAWQADLPPSVGILHVTPASAIERSDSPERQDTKRPRARRQPTDSEIKQAV